MHSLQQHKIFINEKGHVTLLLTVLYTISNNKESFTDFDS